MENKIKENVIIFPHSEMFSFICYYKKRIINNNTGNDIKFDFEYISLLISISFFIESIVKLIIGNKNNYEDNLLKIENKLKYILDYNREEIIFFPRKLNDIRNKILHANPFISDIRSLSSMSLWDNYKEEGFVMNIFDNAIEFKKIICKNYSLGFSNNILFDIINYRCCLINKIIDIKLNKECITYILWISFYLELVVNFVYFKIIKNKSCSHERYYNKIRKIESNLGFKLRKYKKMYSIIEKIRQFRNGIIHSDANNKFNSNNKFLFTSAFIEEAFKQVINFRELLFSKSGISYFDALSSKEIIYFTEK